MIYLSSQQREIGTQNFHTVLGEVRREFLHKSLEAENIGRYYFGYGKVDKPVKAGIVGTGDEGCSAMIRQSSPDYLRYVGFFDIRPSQQERVKKQFKQLYGEKEASAVKQFDSFEAMLADKEIEAIVIATPLWTHHTFAIAAMKAGKHVLCEKLMSRTVAQGKAMVRTSFDTRSVLSIGHQRHYSTLYDNVLAVVKSGVLGQIKHIRAFWHRNNVWPSLDGKGYNDGWAKEIPAPDRAVAVKKYGYRSVEHLVRWRLYNDTGGGLMAELGSHQLDACSLFLNKVHPVTVTGVGGIFFYKDDRECDDHVYCSFQMPNDVVITYSSINTNQLYGYGEVIHGTRGTLMVLNESESLLYKEAEPGDARAATESYVTCKLEKTPSGGEAWNLASTSPKKTPECLLAEVALRRANWFSPVGTIGKMEVNRGYFNEIEAFAHAIRTPGVRVRCDGRVALADAVMALTANVAMHTKTGAPITFQPSWYEPNSPDVPDNDPTALP